MSDPTLPTKYDLFISYAHADDRDPHHLKVTALVEAIKADYRLVTKKDLEVFFDVAAIQGMDDWRHRIETGLLQSKLMVAVLSPSYFRSEYCKLEWETYVKTELYHALPGEGIQPIYIIEDRDGYDADPVAERLRHWVGNLKRRQYIEWREFWPEGAAALERADVRRLLAHLPAQIAERAGRKAIRDATTHKVARPSEHFSGRFEELQTLRSDLQKSQIGVVTAVHGIAGMGKSTLAFAYAWGFAYLYPGGRFQIDAANLGDLASGVVGLAVDKGVTLTDADRRDGTALAKVRKAFEDGPQALIVVDNLEDPALLDPQARERALPRGDHIHVLVTTRTAPEELHRIHCLALDALEPEDALTLLGSFRPIPVSPQDDEWKAAVEIVNRLGGHALAVEVAGVYLRLKSSSVTFRVFADELARDGVSMMEDQVGPRVRGKLAWHPESCIARLLAPTLDIFVNESPQGEAKHALEYAALLPPDNLPLPWLRELLLGDFPHLAGSGLNHPIDDLLHRLDHLRLVVASDRARPRAGSPPGDDHLARMHRLVQGVARHRIDPADAAARTETITNLAIRRAAWIEQNWGKPGLAWELLPLRDLVVRLLDAGDRRAVIMADQITTPLVHAGRSLDGQRLWQKASDLLKRLHAADPSNNVDARDLAVSYEKLGDLERAEGRADIARRYYEDSLAIARRLAEASPDNADYARDLSVSYDRLGDLERTGGRADVARRYYEDSLSIRRRLAEASPDNAEYARDLSVIFNKLGDLERAEGRPDVARRYYDDSLAIARRLAEASPDNAEYARDLSVSYNKLGDLEGAEGRADAARRYYDDSLDIRRRLAEASPDDAGYARDLSVSYNKLGDLERDEDRADVARRYYDDSFVIARRLAEASPDNAKYARDLSVSYNKLGDLERDEDRADAARCYYDDSLAIARRLAEASPDNAEYARDLSVSYNKLGDLERAEGRADAARRYYDDGLSIRRRLAEASPDNAEYARDLSVSYNKLGDLERAEGRADVARRYYNDSLSIRRRLAEASPDNAEYARDLSVSYDRLGDLERAEGRADVARRYYDDDLAIARRLADASPNNAVFARDLVVSFSKMALLLEASDGAEARVWWRRVWDGFAAMKRRGMHIDPTDRSRLDRLNERFGFEP